MFNRKPTAQQTQLDDAIKELLDEMKNEEGHTERYAALRIQLSELARLRKEMQAPRVSADTLALVIGNLAGIIFIVQHERMNVITTKAMSLLLKQR